MNTRSFRVMGVAAAALFCQATAFAKEADMTGAPPTVVGRITGLGGVFFKSRDPKALAAWYRDVMGINVEAWGGAKLSYDAPGHPPAAVWAPFPEDTDQMKPSTRDMMINFAVDDMDAFAARLTAKGVTVHRQPADPFGTFAWILDPDGTKIELWQPSKP